MNKTRPDGRPKTLVGGQSREFMEAKSLFFGPPLECLGEMLGLSRTTLKRIRRRLAALEGGPNWGAKDPKKGGAMARGNGVEAENPESSPSYSYFPPPSKEGVPPRGLTKTGLNETKKKPNPQSKTPCPADWQPRDSDRAYVASLGVDPDRLAARMIDWSQEDPIRNRKANWDATFRNWARSNSERQATEQARLEAQRKNYMQARQDGPQSAADREADRRAQQDRERRQAAREIVRKYHPELGAIR